MVGIVNVLIEVCTFTHSHIHKKGRGVTLVATQRQAVLESFMGFNVHLTLPFPIQGDILP